MLLQIYIDKKIGFGAKDKPVTMEAGMGIIKIVTKGNPLNYIVMHNVRIDLRSERPTLFEKLNM